MEQFSWESATHGRIAIIDEQSLTPITAKSAHGAARTSPRRLSHPARAGFVFRLGSNNSFCFFPFLLSPHPLVYSYTYMYTFSSGRRRFWKKQHRLRYPRISWRKHLLWFWHADKKLCRDMFCSIRQCVSIYRSNGSLECPEKICSIYRWVMSFVHATCNVCGHINGVWIMHQRICHIHRWVMSYLYEAWHVWVALCAYESCTGSLECLERICRICIWVVLYVHEAWHASCYVPVSHALACWSAVRECATYVWGMW